MISTESSRVILPLVRSINFNLVQVWLFERFCSFLTFLPCVDIVFDPSKSNMHVETLIYERILTYLKEGKCFYNRGQESCRDLFITKWTREFRAKNKLKQKRTPDIFFFFSTPPLIHILFLLTSIISSRWGNENKERHHHGRLPWCYI